MGFNRNHNRVGLLACVAGILLFARFLFHEGALQWLFNAGKPLMVALIIIYLLQPIVNWLSQNLHLPRALAVLVSYCFLLAILAFVVGTLIPAIVTNVAEILPKDYTALLDHIAAMPRIRNVIHSGLPQKLAQNIPELLSRYVSPLMKYSTNLLGSVASFFEVLSFFFLSLFMAYYALKDSSGLGCSIAKFLYKTIPVRVADRLLNFLEIINEALRNFITGKCIACFILGMIAYISILLVNLIFRLEIPYPGLFSFLIGITNIIPYIGPLLGALPCLLLSLFEGVPETIAVLAIIIAGQQLDNFLIGPKILGDLSGVSPFWVLASVTCGGLLFGGVGMILAVPAAQVACTLITEYQRSREPNSEGFLGQIPPRFSHLRPKVSRHS